MSPTFPETSRTARVLALLASALVTTALFAVAVLPIASIAAQPPGERCLPPLTQVQKRVLQHAERGVDDLRRFVWITRSIYGLDVFEEAQWAERTRRAAAACLSASPSEGASSE